MSNKRPLAGIRVCDFSWVGSGPNTTRLLAEFGAEVIRIESKSRLDLLRLVGPYKDGIAGIERSGTWSNRNPNKKSIDINMKSPQAKELIVKLIRESDIVINNFTMGVMEKWNLGYEDVKEMKPDIIYVTMPTQGSSGPHKNYMGFGITMNALVGIHYLTGFPDKIPFGMGTNYPDHVPNPVHTAFAIAGALLHRRKTGQGQLIDVSQTEAALAVLPTAVMNYAANGKVLERSGNRNLNVAPHGVYATQGVRRWVAIAVYNQSEWEALLKVMGNPVWADSEKFSSTADRLANLDELDRMIEEWTKKHKAYQLMERLVQAGVRAGVVQNSKDVLEDPHLNERGFWTYLNHQEMRRHVYNSSPLHLSKTPSQVDSPAPLLGEHTDMVMKEVLGLGETEISKLREEDVIG
ncbi:MAG: CoA transferase [Desulfosporosinus sp.]